MKKFILSCIFCVLIFSTSAQDTISVHINIPGTLKDSISGLAQTQVRYLTVSGKIDKRDFQTINFNMEYQLVELDISEASIEAFDNYPANELPFGAFSRKYMFEHQGMKDLKKVILPKTLKKIGNNAFVNCWNLNTVILPKSLVEIGEQSFYYCGLDSISIPSNVTKIGKEAFYKTDIMTVTIPDGISTIAYRTFYNCERLRSLKLGVSVETIEEQAFSNTRISELHFPETLTVIKYKAFAGCGSLSNVTFGNSLIDIGDFAFDGCKSIRVELEFPVSLTRIGKGAFNNCSGISGSLIIPDNVTEIGNQAFYKCKGFTNNLHLGKSLKTIDDSAFHYCENFVGDLIIPDNLTYIGKGSFYQCVRMYGKLSIGNSVNEIGSEAFYECNLGGELKLPQSLKVIGEKAFYKCDNFTGNLNLPDSLNKLEPYAFSKCTGLKGDIVIPKSIKTIKTGVFAGCSGFDGKISLGESVITIEERAFSSCTGITENLIIPNSITSIHRDAFWYCEKISNKLVLGNSVDSLGIRAFAYCKKLDTLILPTSLIHMGQSSFGGYYWSLNAIFVKNPIPIPFDVNTVDPFDGIVKRSCTFFVPAGTKKDYSEAVIWKDFINIREGDGIWLSSTIVQLEQSEGSNQSIEVTSNIKWKANSDVDWLSLSINKGYGNDTMTITAITNPSLESRKATITLSSDNSEKSAKDQNTTISIIQDGKTTATYILSDNEMSFYPNPAGNSIYLNTTETEPKLQIFNIEGKEVLNKIVYGNSFIDISKLKPDLYILTINDKKYKLIKK